MQQLVVRNKGSNNSAKKKLCVQQPKNRERMPLSRLFIPTANVEHKSVDLHHLKRACPVHKNTKDENLNHIPDLLAHHCWLSLTVSRRLSEERRRQYHPSSSLACDEIFF